MLLNSRERVMSVKFSLPKLLVSIAICELAGIIGSVFTLSAIPTWYAALVKPSFSPPNYIFGPVWTTLYALMGIAVYLIWQKGLQKKIVRNALIIFSVHLILNILWSIIFFGLKNIGLALVEIILLWTTLIIVIYKFRRIDPRTTVLLLSYLAWSTFAVYLNYSVWTLNR